MHIWTFLFDLSSLAGSIGTSLAAQELPNNNAFFYYLPMGLFPFVFPPLKEPSFRNFCGCGPLFSYVRACCRRASTANTAQQGAISPAQSRKASTCRPERDNASKQAELATVRMSSSIFTVRFVLKTKIFFFARQQYTTTHKAAEAGVMREGLAFISNLNVKHNSALSLRPFYVFRTCMRRPGCFPGAWSSCIFAIRQFAPKIVDLSCSHNSYFVYILLLLSKRSGEIQPLQLYVKKRGGKSGYAIIFLRWAESVRPLYASGSASMS